MNDLSVQLLCICMRNGVQIWIEKSRAENIINALANPNDDTKFVRYEGRLINRADLVGIFTPADMEDQTRRKNGQTQCTSGNWHDRNEKCTCISRQQAQSIAEQLNRIRECKLGCDNGWQKIENGVHGCECLSPSYATV